MAAGRLKSRVRGFLAPLARLVADMGIPPTAITLAGFALSALAGWSIGTAHFFGAAILLLLAGICDAIDGETARAGNRATRVGAFLDSTVDRYSEIVFLLGALHYYLWRSHASPEAGTAIGIFLAITGSLMVSYTRARGEGIGQECEVGLTERPERMAILFLGAVFGAGTFRIAIWVLAVLSHLTALQRIRHVLARTRT
jgi:CDP-diacylglycerol---glycerol-3-phosphate 3-phosphatidyltransferase